MAHSKSAVKRIRQNEKRRLRNRVHRGRARAMIRKVREAIEANELEEARSLLPEAYAAIDRACRAGVFHARTAARYKSRLARRLVRAESAA